MRTIVLSVVFTACTGAGVELTTPTTDSEPVDLRREFPEPPAGGIQFVTPDYVIPAHTEKMLCYITPYDGATVGIHSQWTFQSPGGHHITVNATTQDEDSAPNGSWVDCTDTASSTMTNLEPLLVGGDLGHDDPEGPSGSLILPDGVAAELETGRRLVLQSHYINTTADDILVRDAINLELVDAAAVTTWAAPVVHLDQGFSLPPGETSTDSFDCAFAQEVDLLFIGGHMHEWGTAFSTELTRAGTGDRETVYEVPEWDPVFRDAPPYLEYAPGEMHLMPGDTFTTNCAWNNDTDAALEFPSEMCVTFAMAYPLKVPVVCEP
ncbi:MAG: hypothetical protein ABMB14_33260 [Myxococcota bacterium]